MFAFGTWMCGAPPSAWLPWECRCVFWSMAGGIVLSNSDQSGVSEHGDLI